MSRTLDLVGKTVGGDPGYKVLSEITSGAFGQVYKVESVKMGYKYAMKVLFPSPKNVIEFNRELIAYELFSSVKKEEGKEPVGCYDYIVCLIDAFIQPIDDRNYYVFVLELMDGELWKLVDMGITTKDSDIMLFYMEILLRGLAYIHSKGVAHNDIKPENILVKLYPDKVPITKYTDFGLSCTDETRPDLFGTKEVFIEALLNLKPPIFTEKGLLDLDVGLLKMFALRHNALRPEQYSLLRCGRQGSPEYISPDIFMAEERDVTLELAQKDDIWALGILFRTLAHGSKLLHFANLNELLAKEEEGVEITTGKFLLALADDVEKNIDTIPVVYDTTEFAHTAEEKRKAALRDQVVKDVIERMSAVKAVDRPTALELEQFIKTAEANI